MLQQKIAMSDIVQKLRDYLSQHPQVNKAFEWAFKHAYSLDIPQFEEYNIHNLDQFIDYYETFLHWLPTENSGGDNVYYHLCLFYFVIDLVPVKFLQTPITPWSGPPYTWLSQWLIDFAKDVGKHMDSPASITPESLATFYKVKSYHMQDYPVPLEGA